MLIAHTVNQSICREEMVVSLGKRNYRLISYRSSDSNWNHKRQTKISSWRWIKRNSISIATYSTPVLVSSEYLKKVEKETILKILEPT